MALPQEDRPSLKFRLWKTRLYPENYQFDRLLAIQTPIPIPNPINSTVPILGGNEKPGTMLHAVRIHSSTMLAGGISFTQSRGGVM